MRTRTVTAFIALALPWILVGDPAAGHRLWAATATDESWPLRS